MLVVLVLVSVGALVGGQRSGAEGKTFPWLGDVILGSCREEACRGDYGRAQTCCNSGESRRYRTSRFIRPLCCVHLSRLSFISLLS